MVLEAFFLSSSTTVTCGKLPVEDGAGESAVLHTANVAQPSELALNDECLDADTAGSLENGDMWDTICPGNTKDPLEALDVESLKTPDVGLVYGPGLTPIQQG